MMSFLNDKKISHKPNKPPGGQKRTHDTIPAATAAPITIAVNIQMNLFTM